MPLTFGMSLAATLPCEDTISPVLRMDCVISRHGTMLITLLELLPSWFTCICTGMRSFSSST